MSVSTLRVVGRVVCGGVRWCAMVCGGVRYSASVRPYGVGHGSWHGWPCLTLMCGGVRWHAVECGKVRLCALVPKYSQYSTSIPRDRRRRVTPRQRADTHADTNLHTSTRSASEVATCPTDEEISPVAPLSSATGSVLEPRTASTSLTLLSRYMNRTSSALSARLKSGPRK